MAVVFSDDIESGNLNGFDEVYDASASSSQANSGTYSAKLGTDAAANIAIINTSEKYWDVAEIWLRWYLRFPSTPAGDIEILRIRNDGEGTDGQVFITSERKLKVLIYAGSGDTGDTQLDINTWHCIQVNYKRRVGGPGTGHITVKLGDTEEATDTGGDNADAYELRWYGDFGDGETNETYMDDFVVDNAEYPGPVGEAALKDPIGCGVIPFAR